MLLRCTYAVIAGLERFAFKGVASNLVTYLTDVMKMSNSSAARTVNSWCGFTSMLPLLVAPFVDSYWDRYCTILASSSLYALVSGIFNLFFLQLFLRKIVLHLNYLYSMFENRYYAPLVMLKMCGKIYINCTNFYGKEFTHKIC